MDNIIYYNTSLAMASIGAKLHKFAGGGPPIIKVNGIFMHNTSSLKPNPGDPPRYAQLYVVDHAVAVQERRPASNNRCDERLLSALSCELIVFNPYVTAFRSHTLNRLVGSSRREFSRPSPRESFFRTDSGMKRKQPQTGGCDIPFKKTRRNPTLGAEKAPEIPAPEAPYRECSFVIGQKVIGLFGGWPYVGVVGAIEFIRMNCGQCFVFLIRWNGFSGKSAQSWVSELDIMAYDEESQTMKQSMEESLRQRTKEAGGKLSALELRKAVTEIVRMFRGRKLAPLRPHTCPYNDEWQTIVRVAAMPKQQLVDHLQGTETLIYERKILFQSSEPSVNDSLVGWLRSNDSATNRQYTDTMRIVFNHYLPKLLLYKFEISPVTKRLVEHGTEDFSLICPTEYFVRLCNLFPQILTAACSGLMGKNDSMTMTLFAFINSHQSFMGYLSNNIDALLRAPRKSATLDGAASETCWVGLFNRNDVVSGPCDDQENETCSPTIDIQQRRTRAKTKRKNRLPSFRPPKSSDVACS
jgi:hypothetical protein